MSEPITEGPRTAFGDWEGYTVGRSVRVGDMLCLHGTSTAMLPTAVANAEPSMSMAMISHRVDDTALRDNGMHTGGSMHEHFYVLDVVDAAQLVSAVMSCLTRAGMMPAFRDALRMLGIRYEDPETDTASPTGGYL